ncbi:hypothetical protein ACGY1D_07555 [Burkholderia pseudomallei]|uniref:hypothetical protein n=1 Tax=Burkholderia pseudomallei TaxID=28450 RepID=UPI001968FEA8|nr:hypothetical protein [Burkholderia pseudomallei]MBF4078361.1 hypothetical protein [Burkholderia pseudomallei]
MKCQRRGIAAGATTALSGSARIPAKHCPPKKRRYFPSLTAAYWRKSTAVFRLFVFRDESILLAAGIANARRYQEWGAFVKLYHSTSVDAAPRIMSDGFIDGQLAGVVGLNLVGVCFSNPPILDCDGNARSCKVTSISMMLLPANGKCLRNAGHLGASGNGSFHPRSSIRGPVAY